MRFIRIVRGLILVLVVALVIYLGISLGTGGPTSTAQPVEVNSPTPISAAPATVTATPAASALSTATTVSSGPANLVVATPAGASTGATETPIPTTAERLAALDENGTPPVGDPEVAQIQAALDKFRVDCTEPEQQIVNYSVGVQKYITSHGIQESLGTIMTHVATALPPNGPRRQCAAVFASYGGQRVEPTPAG